MTVVYSSSPRQVVQVVLDLPAGALVADAIAKVQGLDGFGQIDWSCASVGVWNQPAKAQQTLHDKDRVEIYRPLRVDPKVARRERFAKQGARTSGLFAKRRPGGKAGY